MSEATSICVEYKHVDGWHVFSSMELPGLYVASKSASEAYEDVSTALEKLLELNAGIKCKVEPQLSFVEFIAQKHGNAVHTATPPVLRSQRYAVYACDP